MVWLISTNISFVKTSQKATSNLKGVRKCEPRMHLPEQSAVNSRMMAPPVYTAFLIYHFYVIPQLCQL